MLSTVALLAILVLLAIWTATALLEVKRCPFCQHHVCRCDEKYG